METHRAAKRALEIIEHVAAAAEPMTLSDLARQVDMPKSSAHALIRTLDDEGFLSRDPRGAYSLGPRLLRLLGSLPHTFELPRVARPVMRELMEDVGETVILGVRQGEQIVYVEQVEGPEFIRYVAPLGEPRPLHATSIGKVFLAFLPPAEADALLRETTLRRFTPQTLTGLKALRSELETIRSRGVAYNREESMAGVGAVAAPVFERGELVIAGLSVAGPADRMDRGDLPDRVLAAAERIGASVRGR